MNPSRTLLAIAVLTPLAVRASGWPPIPPEVWAMKEDPARGIKDAVILEDRTIFRSEYMERIYRVRVLSEAGRKAARLSEFSDACSKFDGRTVYPDGKEIAFDKRQDFRREETIVGDLAQKRTLLVPPGVMANCVMELRWLEQTAPWRPLPARMGHRAFWRFGGTYFTLFESVELPNFYPWAYCPLPGRTLKLAIEDKQGFKAFSARNVPANEQPPYSLAVSLDRPVFTTFFQPQTLGREAKDGAKSYWDALGPEIWKDIFESGFWKSEHYRAFKARIFPKLQGKAPQTTALELRALLDQEVLNTSRMTYAELAKRPKGQEIPGRSDLEAICKTGTADREGMVMLYYHLLVDLGIAPKIALVTGRDEWLFLPKLFDPWQLTNVMFAIEEPGKERLLVDPTPRFAPAGMVHPDFQGTQGLLLNPKANWTSEMFEVPIQPAAFNQKRYEYRVAPGEEEDRFNIEAHFNGYPEYAERWKYMVSEPAEQNRLLKEGLEKALKGASIAKTEVLNAANPKETVSWKAEGALEPKGGQQRTVEPFPGMPSPLWIPDAFPRERILPIVMPYLQGHRAHSAIQVPKGFRVRPVPPLDERNRFGRVKWSVEPKTSGEASLAEVALEVSVDSMFAGPEAYEELKAFLGWVSEACGRTLILEKL